MNKMKELWKHLTDWEKSPVYGYFKHPNERKIDGLVKRLSRKGTAAGEEAFKELVKIGVLAVPALIGTLGDEDRNVRASAAEALGEIGDASAVPALIKALGDEDWRVREKAAEALGRIGDASAVPALIKALGDKYVKSVAVRALGKIGDASAVPALIRALGDEDWRVRERAAEALVEIGAPAVPALIGVLRGGREAVRRAVEALGKIGLPAIPALIDALRDESWWVRKGAAEALGKIGDASAVPALIRALGDKDEFVRSGAVYALGKIGDASAVPALIKALGDNVPSIRQMAAEALGEIGPRDSADLRLVANAAKKAKKEGKPVDGFAKVYSEWSKKLNERADALFLDKKFHVPKIEKPEKVERIMRIKRAV